LWIFDDTGCVLHEPSIVNGTNVLSAASQKALVKFYNRPTKILAGNNDKNWNRVQDGPLISGLSKVNRSTVPDRTPRRSQQTRTYTGLSE
jgi:hypothetical protein